VKILNRCNSVFSTECLEATMQGETKERWMQLAEQAANEQDPKKLMVLVAEINRLLEAKQARINAESKREPSP
jgi:hypothetical protein